MRTVSAINDTLPIHAFNATLKKSAQLAPTTRRNGKPMHTGETLIQMLARKHTAVGMAMNKGGLPDEQSSSLGEWYLNLEAQIAQATPTCVQDAIIQLTIAEGNCSNDGFYGYDEPLELEGDSNAIDVALMRSVLAYLKSLRASSAEKVLSLAINRQAQEAATAGNDPAVALWNQLQRTEDMAVKAQSAEEHDRLATEGIALEDRFLETPATSADGVILQVRHLVRLTREYNSPEHESRRFKAIEAGLRNLQPKAVSPQYQLPTQDPVIALWDKQKKAEQRFNAISEEDEPEKHEKLEKIYLKVWEEFHKTPARSLKGLHLQIKDNAKSHDADWQYKALLASIESVIEHIGQ